MKRRNSQAKFVLPRAIPRGSKKQPREAPKVQKNNESSLKIVLCDASLKRNWQILPKHMNFRCNIDFFRAFFRTIDAFLDGRWPRFRTIHSFLDGRWPRFRTIHSFPNVKYPLILNTFNTKYPLILNTLNTKYPLILNTFNTKYPLISNTP